MSEVSTRSQLQRRTLATLSTSQTLGGVGYSAGIAVGSLLAENVSGRTELAGLGGTFQVLGGALLAIPMVRIMARRGRGIGLIFGYGLAVLGAIGLITAAVIGSFTLLLASSILFGGATASNNQTPYAATDLAAPAHRGRDLSLVVWATTVGSVLGPNLVGLANPISRLLHLPLLAGPYAISIVGFLLAIAVIRWALHPDPLLHAQQLATSGQGGRRGSTGALHGSVVRGLRYVSGHRGARLGLLTQALGHTVMVAVMMMTPVHMRAGHATLQIIGLVISIHIVGMYAFSPVVGIAVDRIGTRAVALVGAGVLCVAALLAARSGAGESTVLVVALFLLGVGWSLTYVSGSTLLTAATDESERPGVQGASTLIMGLGGGGGGALAGVIVGAWGYAALALVAFALALSIAVLVGTDLLRAPRGSRDEPVRTG
ncbi:MAG: MFS transporter [Nostocoides sp.]